MDYKKILEGVVDIINTTEKSDIGFANICTYIGEKCPELKESEDERIRKGIIALIEFGLDDKSAIAPGYNITKEEAIAWLEKQGKKLDADKVIECLDEHVPTKFEDMQNYVNQFKKDFRL